MVNKRIHAYTGERFGLRISTLFRKSVCKAKKRLETPVTFFVHLSNQYLFGKSVRKNNKSLKIPTLAYFTLT